VKKLLKEGVIGRAVIIDCDLHQGNGTAVIFSQDRRVFTFSIHQENNYPFFKPHSSMDIGLRDRASDSEYLSALQEHIPRIMHDFKPDFMMYVAGADPYKDDMIGGLALTKKGLRQRDEYICNQAIHYDVPLAVVLAGGYALNEDDTVDIHYNTISTSLGLFHAN
jgi:acetoin utilization deacetylase AcuC-like enzyme